MKQIKLLLLVIGLLLLQLQINLNAQEYVPFPDSNSIWSEVFTSHQPFEIETYQYGILGDTLINSLLYKKVYKLNDTIYPLVINQYCGAIRQDNSKKIFIIGYDCTYPRSGEGEVILYDFSKAVGDTVFVGINGLGPEGYLIINHIDSVLIENNYRKTFHFTSVEDNYWIEGIGSTRGLFSPITAQTTGYQKWELICFNQDNIVKYLNPEFNSCFPILTGINYLPSKKDIIKIYPNPTSSFLNIDFPYNYSIQNITMEIIDINGKIVLKSKATSRLKQFNIKQLNGGLYIVKVQNNKTLITKRIIIQ